MDPIKFVNDSRLSWFDIERYSVISDWDRDKTANELMVRKKLLAYVYGHNEDQNKEWFQRRWENIRESGMALQPGDSIYELKEPTAYVTPLFTFLAEKMCKELSRTKPEELENFKEHPVHYLLPDIDQAVFSIKLDGDIDIILSEVKTFIQKYRAEKKINPREKAHKKGDYEKIKRYQVIPLIDLNIWCHMNNFYIPYKTLNLLVFPDGSKSEQQLTETIQPFINTILGNKMYLSEFRAYRT